MRYTKYNYKKSDNNYIIKVILKIALTVGGAWLCGLFIATLVWKFIPENNTNSISAKADANIKEEETINTANTSIEENDNAAASNNVCTYVSVQCGFFSSEENAKLMLGKISDSYSGFIYNENGKYRVLCGLFSEEQSNNVISDLQGKNIECAKVSYKLNSSNIDENQIAAICDGYLKILNTAISDNVKSVNTKDFKEWTNKLSEVSEGKYIDILASLKKYINELPDEIAKDNVSSEMSYIYGILINFKSE